MKCNGRLEVNCGKQEEQAVISGQIGRVATIVTDEHIPQPAPEPGSLRDRLATIEAALDHGDYKPGPWRRIVDELRDSPQAERAALASDVSRVSRKLHLRERRRTVGVVGAILLEGLAGTLGGLLIAAAFTHRSTLEALVGMALLVTSLEPLIKLSAGTALGVEYDYAYLYGGVEPRFKSGKFVREFSIDPNLGAAFAILNVRVDDENRFAWVDDVTSTISILLFAE
jgi:hypothetical protein